MIARGEQEPELPTCGANCDLPVAFDDGAV